MAQQGIRTAGHSLCETCRQMQLVVSGKGSHFLLCRLALGDPRYAKYPPQPVVHCAGYEPREATSNELVAE